MKKKIISTLVVLIGFFITVSVVGAQAPAPVANTGWDYSYMIGDDGYWQKGMSISPRFTDNGDETVLDNLTGLMWAKNANLDNGTMPWVRAITYANNLNLGSDGCGSSYTDWRLPNVKELQSLIDFSNFFPGLPSGHPFVNVQSYYISSTAMAEPMLFLTLSVSLDSGGVDINWDGGSGYVWPVRGGN